MYFNALEAIDTNIDLAYSMFVYLLEALSNTLDSHKPEWIDYDTNIRDDLDIELSKIDPAIAGEIRSILLKNSHLKLMKKFVDFTSSHLRDSFFTDEARSIISAVPKSHLHRALKNLYATRSGFVHNLSQVHDMIRVAIHDGDLMEWDNEPYFTIPGLARLCRHVLLTFIDRQPYIDREHYPWRDELPGIIRARLHPSLWIWNAKNFDSTKSPQIFNGFTEVLLESIRNPPQGLPDMRELLIIIENDIPNAKLDFKKTMLCIYHLWHIFIKEDGKRPNWQNILRQHENLLNQCFIENITSHILSDRSIPWTGSDCEAAFNSYVSKQYKPNAIHLPIGLAIAVEAAIANIFLTESKTSKFDRWIERAVLDSAGQATVQDYLAECKRNRESARLEVILQR
jgi:hypothetical protein